MTDQDLADDIRLRIERLNKALQDGYERGFQVRIMDSRGNELFGTLEVDEIKKVTTELL